jgi:hypothetical protein
MGLEELSMQGREFVFWKASVLNIITFNPKYPIQDFITTVSSK